MAVTNFKFTKIDNIIEIFDTFVPDKNTILINDFPN